MFFNSSINLKVYNHINFLRKYFSYSTAYYTISPKWSKLFLIYYVIDIFIFQILGRMASKPNLWCCPCSKKPEFKILLSHSQSRGRGHHGVPGTPLECLGGRPLINRSPILVIFWGKIKNAGISNFYTVLAQKYMYALMCRINVHARLIPAMFVS